MVFLTFLYSRDFYFTGARESPNVDLLVQRKVTKEKTPLLRNFLPYQAKTALSAPRRYRSCPSELLVAILNQGNFGFVKPFGYACSILKTVNHKLFFRISNFYFLILKTSFLFILFSFISCLIYQFYLPQTEDCYCRLNPELLAAIQNQGNFEFV